MPQVMGAKRVSLLGDNRRGRGIRSSHHRLGRLGECTIRSPRSMAQGQAASGRARNTIARESEAGELKRTSLVRHFGYIWEVSVGVRGVLDLCKRELGRKLVVGYVDVVKVRRKKIGVARARKKIKLDDLSPTLRMRLRTYLLPSGSRDGYFFFLSSSHICE